MNLITKEEGKPKDLLNFGLEILRYEPRRRTVQEQ